MERKHEVSLVDKLKNTREGRERLLTERAIIRVTEQLEEAMEATGRNRADFARLLGKSKGWVTQLLDGENNKTIRTVAYAFAVLGAQFETMYSFPPDAQPVVIEGISRLTFDLEGNFWTAVQEPYKAWDKAASIKGLPKHFSQAAIARATNVT